YEASPSVAIGRHHHVGGDGVVAGHFSAQLAEAAGVLAFEVVGFGRIGHDTLHLVVGCFHTGVAAVGFHDFPPVTADEGAIAEVEVAVDVRLCTLQHGQDADAIQRLPVRGVVSGDIEQRGQRIDVPGYLVHRP